jgi:hypothetical protein
MSKPKHLPLIDWYLPHYDYQTSHALTLEATPRQVYQALLKQNLASSFWSRLLFRLRGLPTEGMNLKEMQKLGFIPLARINNREFLLGIVGKFWRPTGFLQRLSPEEFLAFDKEGYAKAVWEFHLNALGPKSTFLSTETRIQCLGKHSKRWFALYWATIEPFSSQIRKSFLKSIAKAIKG